MASRFILPLADVGNGISPSDGAKLTFFITGTATLKNTFSDEAATTPNTNPVVSDGDGLFPEIWITGTYKVTLTDKNNVPKWEEDPVIEGFTAGDDDARYSATFGSVASMLTLTPTDGIAYTPVSGQSVYLTSYQTSIPFTEPQGGGGHFRVMTLAEYGLTPDEIGAAFTVGSFAFVRAFGEKVRPQYFGAVGDGTADDTLPIRAAAQFIVSRGYGTLYFSAGTYAISGGLLQDGSGNTLDWQWNMAILGDGKRASRFIPFSATSDVLFHLDNSTVNFGFFTVQGLGIMDNAGTSLFTGDAFRVGSPNSDFVGLDILFSDITVHRVDSAAFRFFNCTDSAMENIYVHSCGFEATQTSSVIFDASQVGDDVNNIRLDNVHVENQKYYALEAIDCSNINWIGGKIHDFGDTPNVQGIIYRGVFAFKLIGVTCSTSNQQHVACVDSASLRACTGGSIIGCSFGRTNNLKDAVELFGATDYITVDNNYFNSDITGDSFTDSSTGANNFYGFGNRSEVTEPDTRTISGFTSTGDVTVEGSVKVDTKLSISNSGSLTIASGAITVTGTSHTIDTEGAASSDDLDTINGGTIVGQLLYILPINAARTVVMKDATDNLRLNGDFSMNNVNDTMVLIWGGSVWREISRSDNGS